MENASRQLQNKFDIARTLFEKAATAAETVKIPATTLQALNNELAAIEMRFALSTAHLYLSLKGSESARLAATTEFARVLAAEGFATDVDRLMTRVESELRRAGVPLRDTSATATKAMQKSKSVGTTAKAAVATTTTKPVKKAPTNGTKAPIPPSLCIEIQRLVDTYPRITAGSSSGASPGSVMTAFGAPVSVDYDKCSNCGGETSVDAGRSELHCGECGAVKELVGTVFEDCQFFATEGLRAKSGTFNPNRHFQFWWAHILAREPEEELGDKNDPDNLYGEKVLAKLREFVVRDRKVLRLLTVNDIRAMLREIGRTDLNKNCPLILKKLTGIGPPSIPDDIQIRAENLFTKSLEIAELVRSDDRVNRNYYPYFVFKLMENLLPRENYELCRIFWYLYFQSKETVEADDANWEQICVELGEIKYIPTDRSLGSKYPPL